MRTASPICFEVRASVIHRFGLFATTDIPPGTSIVEYRGPRISKAESLRRCAAGNTFLVAWDTNKDIDGDVAENPARFANHGCEPNCELVRAGESLWIVSARSIAGGEELTFDYGYDPDGFRDEPCRCGSERCVGFIVGGPFQESVRRLLANIR